MTSRGLPQRGLVPGLPSQSHPGGLPSICMAPIAEAVLEENRKLWVFLQSLMVGFQYLSTTMPRV